MILSPSGGIYAAGNFFALFLKKYIVYSEKMI